MYRVGLKVPGIAILRNYDVDAAIAALLIKNDDTKMKMPFILPKSRANSEDVIKVCQFLSGLDPKKWAKRIETNHLDVYTNDQEIYDQCKQALEFAVVSASAPESDFIDVLELKNHVAVKKYPHDRYRFKVYLQPHKLKGDTEAKIKFLDWLDTQERILISSAVKTWFKNTDWNWDRRYVLVEDSDTLLMLKMRGSEVCGMIHEYVLVDK